MISTTIAVIAVAVACCLAAAMLLGELSRDDHGRKPEDV